MSENNQPAIRVLIVDDHDVVRFALKVGLSVTEGIEVVGEAANGQEAVEAARRWQPDVILMDLLMPRMTGVEATTAIHQQYPQIAIVILTSGTEPELIDQALDAGAKAYLLKQVGGSEIVQAIHQAYQPNNK